ncbi:TetR/AcrR family transcriptional regulator [Actinoalloteichus sp. GBA129-24]|uniref:Transcriptional regulator, TetR family n=2 Tax=Actinoalloteichus fjordicus TaxID=1612552 RepID=A0AAC9L987_9PSEU|nr:TetR/AcrR family transcriptional regulator [Actinoalloteichus sp. GBA129-24]APU13276.1 transcriptional regulator, TetR family [Actinoalloteichus fjordicus]APU19227.1 transcriptional regulator, TetR family [Actinoalloteichus sp. GBA129-24]
MAGRPRTVSEERIMAAVASAVGRVGPVRLTLAEVARDAEVSTGVLVQRYGSKRGLLLAFIGSGLAQRAFHVPMRAAFAEAPDDPVEGVIRAVAATVGPDRSPDEFANHLAFLHLELADEEFRTLLGDYARAVQAELARLLRTAVAAGAISEDIDVDALAAALDSVRNGTQITWAMTRTGRLADAVRRDLTMLLDPYRRRAEETKQ